MSGRDLMFQDEVRTLVRDAYAALTTADAAGVGYYTDTQRTTVPASALDWSLGVGNPLAWAALRPGEDVLDIGCGAGIDALLAARAVGPTGSVTGVDLLPVMIARARHHAAVAGIDNARFVQGEMESLPLPDRCVDVVVSNGVVNLSPRKSRVLAEALRVLRPGGRLCLTDLTIRDDGLPPEILVHPSPWAGCVAGALAEPLLRHKLERVGFEDIRSVERHPFSLEDAARYPLFTADLLDLMRTLIPVEQHDELAVAVTITARRPGP